MKSRHVLIAVVAVLLITPRAFGAQPVCLMVQGPVGAPFPDCALGQAHNILPPGANGLVNATDFAKQEGGLGPAPHQQDQLAPYANLELVAPHLQAADLAQYYKDASFGVPADQIERIETPRPGTVIVRDKAFGTPHIFGNTRYDTEFGSGYAAAEDRLFFMDVLRHVGRSQVSAFLGPSDSALALDCSIARVAGYNEAELQQQAEQMAAEFSAPFDATHTEGEQIQADAQAYVDGVNAYIQAALTNPDLMPVEYPALQEVPAPWKPTDIIATATLVQATFAIGGGNEVDSALFNGMLVARYGAAQGNAIWTDFRSQNDPEAPTTLDTVFPYMTGGTVDPNAVAMPLAPAQTDFCDGGPIPAARPGLGQITVGPVSVDLSALLRTNAHASNALVVGRTLSTSGHPIAVFGPQTGYFAPEILHEIELHGPGLHARGAAFPGTEVFVELGRGVDYAWSATSASADIIDERLEKLCNPDGSPPTLSSTSYVFNGACVPMYERTDRQLAKPSAGGTGAPTVITIQIERTVHGPVVGRTTALDPATGQPIPVAVSLQRSTWFDELSATPAFLEWNDPDFIHGARDFLRAAAKETGTFNWFYVDATDIAYYQSGQLPIRAAGVDPSFPSWGTGAWEWQGFLLADGSGLDPHPHAVNPPLGWMTNWNNKPAPGFSAADNNYAYGPVYRVQSLSERLQARFALGKVQPVDVVNAMEDAGSVDLDGSQLVTQLSAVLAGAALSPAQSSVLSILQSWAAHGAHRRALAEPERYDEGNAVAIMDALYPRLAHAIFDRWLDGDQYALLASLNPINNPPGPVGSAYDGGWEGYLQRSLRQASDPTIANPYSQTYCGGSGGKPACQAAVIAALQAAIDALTAAYGTSDPAAWSCARGNQAGQCNPAADDIQFSAVGVVSVPGIPWINRPTFQQVVHFPARRKSK
jgi:acyl-homoserine lactone acylase PvdQ